MASQLTLLDSPFDSEPAYDHARFKLDRRTRAVGLAGIARARAVLEAARQAHEHHATSSAA